MKALSVLKLVLILLFALTGSTVHAQDALGYFFFAPGGQEGSRAYAAGGGVQAILQPHLWIGGEVSAITPGKGKTSDNVVGIFSLNGYVPIRGAGHRLDPFGTFGYSLLFRDFTANGFNYGVGTNYWLSSNWGLVLEGQDTYASIQNATTHLWEIRVGLKYHWGG